jgi:hypothetical protein
VLNILTCFAAIGLCAPNASAMKLTFEDSLWTGWFDPCASGVATAKLGCVDGLITLAPNGGRALAGPPSPTASTGVPAGQTDANTPGIAHNVSGFADLLAQYSGLTGHLWLGVSLTGTMTIPGSTTIPANLAPGHQPSSSGPGVAGVDAVPDGGATAALLGLGLLAIRLVSSASRRG